MHVAVVGAGASGLSAARHLLDKKNGFTCEVFERNEAVGGTWFYTDDVGTDKYGFPVYACMYSGLQTNLPKEVMCFSDYKFPEQDRSYVSQEEVLTFLNTFADHYNLRPHIKLSTLVSEIKPIAKGRWSIKTVHIPTKQETVKEFDAVMVCSGHFNEGLFPNIPGRDQFKGLQVHSHDYRKPEPYRNKKVLIIGAGPSGLDLALILSNYAQAITLSHHANETIKAQFASNVTLKPDVTRITENGAEFSDDTTATFDCIFYCTGYKYKYPFLTDACKIIIEDDVYMRPLYKHLINIEHPTMCFTGIPYRACSFPMYDLQIRYYIEYLNGSMKLPSKEKMYEDTAKDLEKRKEKGYTKKQYHLMSVDFVWDYYKDLSDSAKIENIWPAVVKLRLEGARQIGQNLLTFRKDKYKIVDREHYEKIN